MQKRVNESEKKHITTVGMLKEQIEILSDKYETAKQIILELNSEKELANDKVCNLGCFPFNFLFSYQPSFQSSVTYTFKVS